MKLLIRDYLASLKEREELDAVLPDLLSELGFNVYSRPGRGTSQLGVDIAAVGEDEDGERKIFLFSVKKSDLTRQDWDGTPQALRSSLNQIKSTYIRNRIPKRYEKLKIVICLAFGGDVKEQVREDLTAYIDENTTEKVSFDEWNGDKIAGLILNGILREKILPQSMRSSFQKAVAMIDEPDVSYIHFECLAYSLLSAGKKSKKARLRSARQLNICLWILFAWARDVGNLEAPYRVSELVLLCIWELQRPTIGKKDRHAKDFHFAIQQSIDLHLTIASEFIELKVFPHLEVRHGLSLSIGSRSALDVNLALFELLGRIGLTGLWLHWISGLDKENNNKAIREGVVKFVQAGLSLIRNNPALLLPITDRQCTDIALFLQLWLASGIDRIGVVSWLCEMADRLDFTIRTRGNYPSSSSDYRELAEHPGDRSDSYFKETTAGSTLIPVISAWLRAFGQADKVKMLSTLVSEKLDHCTLQLWMPDTVSETKLCIGDNDHGRALCNLSLKDDGSQLLMTIEEACKTDKAFENLTLNKTGFWPLLLMACRHHQMPIPPQFWINALKPTSDSSDEHESC